MPEQNTSTTIPPLLQELTDEEFAKIALLSTLTNDVAFIHLVTLLDFRQVMKLLVVCKRSRLCVPKMKLFDRIKRVVEAVVAVIERELTLAQAVRVCKTPKRLLRQFVEFTQSHMTRVRNNSRREAHRKAKQRYRAKRRAEGFSTRGRPLRK